MNRLSYGDNLDVMPSIASGSVDPLVEECKRPKMPLTLLPYIAAEKHVTKALMGTLFDEL